MALPRFRLAPTRWLTRPLALGALALLAGCSFASDALFPAIEGADGRSGLSTDFTSPPALGSTTFDPGRVTPGEPTGTFVGQKVITFRTELTQLQDAIRLRNQQLQDLRAKTAMDAGAYHQTVALINSRLQGGTTPSNPELTDRWAQARSQISEVERDISLMNQLSTEVAKESALAAYLLESVRAAFNLAGAVDEDHRQLRILEDETNQTVVLIERLLSELNRDITRQERYVENEKANLTTLALAIKSGSLYGQSLASLAGGGFGGPSPLAGQPAFGTGTVGQLRGLPPTSIAERRPLVVIRFDPQQANVEYEQALFNAVSQALERRPAATFDLVAVTPQSASPSDATIRTNRVRRDAEQVLRSLTSMGLPPERISLSASTSPQAQTNEVHLYVN